MGNYDRNDRGGSRGGYAPRGRSSFGGGRGYDRGGGRSFDRGGDRQMFDAICSNCGKACQVPFRPTGEKPVYCSDCFEKMGGRSFDRGGDRQMFDAICSNCGKACQVPFRPTGEKPVYCSDCFEKMGGRNDSPRPGGFDRPARPDFASRAPTPSVDQNKGQLEAINAKLDRLLKLLEPKVAEPIVSAPIVEKVKEPKTPKAKKINKVTLEK